jgi:hypothetical protein
MARVGFKLKLPVFERAKTFRALDRAATVTGLFVLTSMRDICLCHAELLELIIITELSVE